MTRLASIARIEATASTGINVLLRRSRNGRSGSSIGQKTPASRNIGMDLLVLELFEHKGLLAVELVLGCTDE